MRSQKSRSRSKGNRNNNRNVGNVVNRVFDSSGPEGKVRGTPQQIIDKYNQLTRDAQVSNDRVAAENFQQHAEHYTRMLAEAMREQQERQERQQQNQQNQPRRHDDSGGQDVQDQRNPQRDEIAAEQPRSRPRPKSKSDSDVIDMDQDSESSGLVETPEERPARPRRTRRKAPIADAGEAAEQPNAPTPDAAE